MGFIEHLNITTVSLKGKKNANKQILLTYVIGVNIYNLFFFAFLPCCCCHYK